MMIKMTTNDVRRKRNSHQWIYLSELRITADEEEILDTENIKPGDKSICHASVQLLLNHRGVNLKTAKAKLDSCGSVSMSGKVFVAPESTVLMYSYQPW